MTGENPAAVRGTSLGDGSDGAPTITVAARVEGRPARIFLHGVGDEPTVLGADLIEPLFRLGVVLGPLRPDRSRSRGRLVVEGDVRFLVGKVDIGRRRGARALRDGFEQALNRGARDLEHQARGASVSSASPPPDATATGSRPDPRDAPRGRAGEDPRPPDRFVEVDDFIADVDEWLDVVEHGTHLMLTRQGLSVASVVPWEWVRSTREKLAWIETAYWSAWAGGRFDTERFVELVDGAITPPDGPTTQLKADDDDDADGPGDVAVD